MKRVLKMRTVGCKKIVVSVTSQRLWYYLIMANAISKLALLVLVSTFAAGCAEASAPVYDEQPAPDAGNGADAEVDHSIAVQKVPQCLHTQNIIVCPGDNVASMVDPSTKCTDTTVADSKCEVWQCVAECGKF